jgi:hypothetical protein
MHEDKSLTRQPTNQVGPIVLANFNPLRLVVRDESDSWDATLDQVNARTYDYVRLHRLSTFFDVGIGPFSLGICFDGTLILPATEEFRVAQNAQAVFNRALSDILLGGIYCEAVTPDDIAYGTVTPAGYTRAYGGGEGDIARFHFAARTKHIGNLDAIRLLRPESVSVHDLSSALSRGRRLVEPLGGLPREQVLHAVTYFAKKQWAESLIHSWTTTERIIEDAWKLNVCSQSLAPSKKRREFLNDHRTWTSSAKLEVLFQKGLLGSGTYEALDRSRKARNEFAHRGVAPSQRDALTALSGLFELASLCASGYKDGGQFEHVVRLAESRCHPEPFPDFRYVPSDASHWIELPPIPGDVQWGDRPIEIIDDICLQPIAPPGANAQSSRSGRRRAPVARSRP